jgi:hypothetical protein
VQLRQAPDVILGRDTGQFFVERLQHCAIEQRFGRQPRRRLRESVAAAGRQQQCGDAHARNLVRFANLLSERRPAWHGCSM